MKQKIEKDKESFTVRMTPALYDKMQEKLKQFRKRKSINSYINELIEKDLGGNK
ncbi:MAG: hypothetical protein FWE53_02390 [Firmicutes bacterium]|nr:hypothetical protein [Bacillota bacterium]